MMLAWGDVLLGVPVTPESWVGGEVAGAGCGDVAVEEGEMKYRAEEFDAMPVGTVLFRAGVGYNDEPQTIRVKVNDTEWIDIPLYRELTANWRRVRWQMYHADYTHRADPRALSAPDPTGPPAPEAGSANSAEAA